MRTRRPARVPVLLVAVGVLLGAAACSGEESGSSLPKPKAGFCEAAQHYDQRVERGAKLDEQIQIVAKMQRNAPKDIAAATTLFLDSLRKLRDGDTSVVDNPKVERAVQAVNRRAQNGCDFFQQQPGSGL